MSTSCPFLSIIVPIYNVEKYLKRCVDSILNQTLKEIEVILVDDASPDKCPQLCDLFATMDSRIQVIHKQNEGLGFARNSGMELAKGEYVYFVDSDIIPPKQISAFSFFADVYNTSNAFKHK